MKKQVWNSATSLILQFVTIAVGLILPRLMIRAFGSAANGLVSSLTQFLSYVTLFEGGIGAVVRAALYKKFALKDDNAVSAVLKATEKFYQKLCAGFVGYALILLVIYPTFINKSFDNKSLSSDLIAENAGISHPHMCRLFKAAYNMTPHDYIIHTRIEHAKYLLCGEKSMTVQAISDICGFNSSGYFIKVFKAKTGITPMEFRIQNTYNF